MIVIEGAGDWPLWGKLAWLSMGPMMVALAWWLCRWTDAREPGEQKRNG